MAFYVGFVFFHSTIEMMLFEKEVSDYKLTYGVRNKRIKAKKIKVGITIKKAASNI
jgi:hypothetical protein